MSTGVWGPAVIAGALRLSNVNATARKYNPTGDSETSAPQKEAD